LRVSRPVVGGAEGEISSVYLPLKNQGVFQLLKEVTFRGILGFFTLKYLAKSDLGLYIH
jgi:hypothetical protein